MKKYTLNKDERIKAKKLFDSIFTDGESLKSGFIRINFVKSEFDSKYPVKVAFSVPKKIFKRAVKRNLLKRRMREAYRNNKLPLYEFLTLNNIKISLLFVYLATDIKYFDEIEKKIIETLNKLQNKIKNQI